MNVARQNMKVARQMDGLSRGTRTLVWLGIALVSVLVITLTGSIFGDPTLGWSKGGLFVILIAAAGEGGSRFRNRRHSR